MKNGEREEVREEREKEGKKHLGAVGSGFFSMRKL